MAVAPRFVTVRGAWPTEEEDVRGLGHLPGEGRTAEGLRRGKENKPLASMVWIGEASGVVSPWMRLNPEAIPWGARRGHGNEGGERFRRHPGRC